MSPRPFTSPAPRDEHGRPLDSIELHGIEVSCIVGIYPGERDVPQPLRLDVAVFLDTRRAARGGGLRATVDYGRLQGELRFLLESCRFQLLESAADALVHYLLAPPTGERTRSPAAAATVRLTKPSALASAAVASLEVHREASEISVTVETKPFGEVDVIHEGKEYGIYRLRIAPGRSIPTHHHQVMEESELVLGSGLHLQGRPVVPGTAHRWPHGLPHRYDNPTDVEQAILCVDRPPFIPGDEVEVPEPPAGFTVIEGKAYYPAGERAR